MAEILNQNQEAARGGLSRLTLSERLTNYSQEKNQWRNLNGGCAIGENMEETLSKLTNSVQPQQENLPDLVRGAIQKYSANGQTIEQIWEEKRADGANYVGVIDGEFKFYQGERELRVETRPLSIPATPRIFEYRGIAENTVHEQARNELRLLKASLRRGESGIINGGNPPV